MKILRISVITVLASFILYTACLAANAAMVKGRVLDTKGNPVSGIIIQLIDMRAELNDQKMVKETTVSDEKGCYELKSAESPSLGDNIIVAYEKNVWLGVTCIYPGLSFRNGETIVVSHPGSFEGKVLDKDQKPLTGVKVEPMYFFVKGNTRWPMTIPCDALREVAEIPSAVTDTNGCYKLENIPESMEPIVQLSKEGYAMQSYDIYSEQMPKNMVMIPGGSVSGSVIDASGKGIAGLQIAATQGNAFMMGPSTLTDADGAFTVGGLTGQRVRLLITDKKQGWYFSTECTARVGQTTDIKSVRIPALVEIKGKVVDAKTGKPLEGARLFASSNDLSSMSISDKNGDYALQAPVGSVGLSYYGGLATYSFEDNTRKAPIKVPDKGLKNHIIKLKSMPSAHGKVFDASGKPVSGATVSIGIENAHFSAATDKAGKFSIPVPPDSWISDMRIGQGENRILLHAFNAESKMGTLLAIDRDTLLKKGVIMRLKPNKSLNIMVKDSSGNAIQGARVSVCAEFVGSVISVGSSYTETNGVGTIKGLYPGMPLEVTVGKPGYYELDEWKKEHTVSSSNQDDTMEIVLTPYMKARGKVVDSQGNPVPGATVQMASNIESAVSDANGEFVAPMIDPERHSDSITIAATSADRKSGIVEYVDPGKIAEDYTVLKLKPARSLLVTAKDTAGKPIKGAVVTLGPYENGNTPYRTVSEETDENGEATLDNLLVGAKYSMGISCPGFYFPEGYNLVDGVSILRVGSANWKDQITAVMETADRVVTGKVIDEKGKPVAGAKVHMSINDDNNVEAISDTKGCFTLEELPHAHIYLNAEADGHYGYAEAPKDTKYVVIKLNR